MAEIATYQCSNHKCNLTLRIGRDFPVWHPDTPKEFRATPVRPSAVQYVVRYRSESFCAPCGRVVEHTESLACVECSGVVVAEHLHAQCVRCEKGTFLMPRISVY